VQQSRFGSVRLPVRCWQHFLRAYALTVAVSADPTRTIGAVLGGSSA
jgi:hypothetical protein